MVDRQSWPRRAPWQAQQTLLWYLAITERQGLTTVGLSRLPMYGSGHCLIQFWAYRAWRFDYDSHFPGLTWFDVSCWTCFVVPLVISKVAGWGPMKFRLRDDSCQNLTCYIPCIQRQGDQILKFISVQVTITSTCQVACSVRNGGSFTVRFCVVNRYRKE